MKQAKEMKDTSDVNSRNIVDYFGVSMHAMEFRKCNDKSGDVYWFMVKCKKYIDTIVNTLVCKNKIHVVTEQGIRSNSS